MLISIRDREHPDLRYLGIPLKQWYIDTDDGKKLRIFILCPVFDGANNYCEVEIAVEESDEWLAAGQSDSCSTSPLNDRDLPKLDDETDQDLYYVWDDGAGHHKGRAVRLYKRFQSLIDEHAGEARAIRVQAAENKYQQKLKYAHENGWEKELVVKENVFGHFGRY